MKLIKSCFKCLVCGDVLESTYQHDFKVCSCTPSNLAVDGGLCYVKVSGDMKKIQDLCVYEDD